MASEVQHKSSLPTYETHARYPPPDAQINPHIGQCSPKQGSFANHAPVGNVSGDTLDVTVGGATGIRWVGAGEAAKQPTMQGTASTAKDDLSPNVNSAKVEKP